MHFDKPRNDRIRRRINHLAGSSRLVWNNFPDAVVDDHDIHVFPVSGRHTIQHLTGMNDPGLVILLLLPFQIAGHCAHLTCYYVQPMQFIMAEVHQLFTICSP
jgi:hypothetical protein